MDSEAIYVAAREGFEALSTLLGKDNYFFGGETPSLLDASVFAYTHLLLDEDLGNGWQETRLCRVVQDHPNLVRHRKRIYKGWYM
jgi:metaxin